ncbi:hypothetical protein D3C81_1804860 [compost metagenome]
MGQQVFGASPAFMLAANQVVHRYAHVVEEHLVHMMTTVERDDRPHSDTGGLHVDQQERNPALLLRIGIGTHQAEHPVGVMAGRGPGLLAIDHIVITLANRAGFQAGQV